MEQESRGEKGTRPVLVRELDEVIEESSERLRYSLDQVRVIAEEIRSDWTIYRSSIQLRDRFSPGTKPDQDLYDAILPLLRAFSQLEHPPLAQRGRARPSARGGSFISSSRGAATEPPDRISQVRQVLSENESDPMDTEAIAAALHERGWLGDVTDARATVSAALSRATRLGLIERVSRGTYQMASAGSERGSPEGGDQGDSTSTHARKEEPHEVQTPS